MISLKSDKIGSAEFPDGVQLLPGNGGLLKLQISCPQAEGEIYLYGAHITSWKPADSVDVLWTSSKSVWEIGKPIRGGVPVCFPWFGPKKDDPRAPMHGFARINEWQLDAVTAEHDSIVVTLSLKSDPSTKQWWPFDFVTRMRVTFGTQLIVSLEVENASDVPFAIEEAFHTYFGVGDVRQIQIPALDGQSYLDRTEKEKEKMQQGAVRLNGETNRVYQASIEPIEIQDPVMRRSIRMSKKNSRETVVWNPWAATAKTLPDFGDDEWPGMVCVEACNAVTTSLQLAPGERHTMTAMMEVNSLE